MKRFGVIGHPIAHSLSPLLHGTAFAMLGLDCSYESFDVAPESLRGAVQDFRRQGFAGLNVTLPHKEKIVAFTDELSDEARMVGAVNTLSFAGDRVKGDNTDVYGFSASLRQYAEEIRGSVVLLIGAGGSARAIIYALLHNYPPSEIVIANRNSDRAAELLRDFGSNLRRTVVRSIPIGGLEMDRAVPKARLIVNATPVGMYPAIDRSSVGDHVAFQPNQIVMDTIYTPLETKLLASARKCGARTISGLEMFLHQGARSFEIWLERQMPVDDLRQVIVNKLKTTATSTNS